MSTFNAYQYDDLSQKNHDVYAQAKYDILLDLLGQRKGLRILNAGCGSGDLSLRLAARGHRVVGIDPEPAYIDLALRNAAAHPAADCEFVVASMEAYADAEGFDCAVSTDVLEHIADDRSAFENLAHLVKPGGTILITVPAGEWLFGHHDELLGHHRRYTPRSLRALVSAHCTVDVLRHFGLTLVPVCCLYSRLLRRPAPYAQYGNPTRRPFVAGTLRGLLQLERRLPMPLGTSLIFKGTRRGLPTPRKAIGRISPPLSWDQELRARRSA
jgi:2-polyprenyl-3-methyl-5-hydroxy-6-metoxy-1,4-benzoquinol methylase